MRWRLADAVSNPCTFGYSRALALFPRKRVPAGRMLSISILSSHRHPERSRRIYSAIAEKGETLAGSPPSSCLFKNSRRFLISAPHHHSTLHSPHSTLGKRPNHQLSTTDYQTNSTKHAKRTVHRKSLPMSGPFSLHSKIFINPCAQIANARADQAEHNRPGTRPLQ